MGWSVERDVRVSCSFIQYVSSLIHSNAVELLIAILAMVKGELDLVQASMIGSILSNSESSPCSMADRTNFSLARSRNELLCRRTPIPRAALRARRCTDAHLAPGLIGEFSFNQSCSINRPALTIRSPRLSFPPRSTTRTLQHPRWSHKHVVQMPPHPVKSSTACSPCREDSVSSFSQHTACSLLSSSTRTPTSLPCPESRRSTLFPGHRLITDQCFLDPTGCHRMIAAVLPTLPLRAAVEVDPTMAD